MQASEILRQARGLVEQGWTEPLTVNEDGTLFVQRPDCTPKRWSVYDAVLVHCESSDEFVGAMGFLERVALPAMAALDRAAEDLLAGRIQAEEVVAAAQVPGSGWTLQSWLESPKRTRDQVLAAFDTAVLRARRLEAAAE
jgi:hypothetical protein